MRKIYFGLLILSFGFVSACQSGASTIARQNAPVLFSSASAEPIFSEIESEAIRKLLESAIEQTNLTKSYDPSYIVIKYPNGDVPIEKGCLHGCRNSRV